MVGLQRRPTVVGNALPTLDHLVHKVDSGQLELAISSFSALGFTVKRGGKHIDGLTSNVQICFSDGVYIELVAFEDRPPASTGEKQPAFDQRKHAHPWWTKRVGWVDWCLLGGATDGRAVRINRLAEECGGEVRYSLPREGGRLTVDKKGIEWRLSTPEPAQLRSAVPFWCEDITPREWRVPPPDPPHRNRSSGISAITLLYAPGDFLASALHNLTLILDNAPTRDFTQTQPSLPTTTLELNVLSPQGNRIPVHVRVADDPSELAWVAASGPGLFEVEIRVAADQLPSTAPPDGLERSLWMQKWGRVRLHPVFGRQMREFWD